MPSQSNRKIIETIAATAACCEVVKRHDYPQVGYDSEMGGEAVYDEKIRFFESKAQKTAYDMDKQGHSLNQIAKTIFGYVNGQKTAKIKQWLSEI